MQEVCDRTGSRCLSSKVDASSTGLTITGGSAGTAAIQPAQLSKAGSPQESRISAEDHPVVRTPTVIVFRIEICHLNLLLFFSKDQT